MFDMNMDKNISLLISYIDESSEFFNSFTLFLLLHSFKFLIKL